MVAIINAHRLFSEFRYLAPFRNAGVSNQVVSNMEFEFRTEWSAGAILVLNKSEF